MKTLLGTTLAVALLLVGQSQLLYSCGSWHPSYFSSGFWHYGYYTNRWCPLLPPRS
jgi:hypothetical protein